MDNRTESRLVQANNGRLAGGVIDGHNVKAQRALFDVALAKEVMRGANKGFVFSLGDAQFDKREGISVEADEVELAFGMLRHMVSGNEDIAEAPQVPVSICFPTHACLQRLKLLRLGRGRGWAGKTAAHLPLHGRKSDSSEHLPPWLLHEYKPIQDKHKSRGRQDFLRPRDL